MTYHPDTDALIPYFKQTIAEMINPVEMALWDNWQPGDNTPDSLGAILANLTIFAAHIASKDNNISILEELFVEDIRQAFGYDSYGNFGELMRTFLNQNPEYKYKQLEMPSIITILEGHDVVYGTDYAQKAKSMYWRFANAVVKADGAVTEEEEALLSEIKSILYPPTLATTFANEREHPIANQFDAPYKQERAKTLDELLDELGSLVGLNTVKNDVIQLVNFLKVQQLRESKGMATVPISRHLVFYGNPGTGKTTVARLLSQIYKSLNIISSGHLVETDRSGLVAGYVGQTALKVKDVVARALGGILFIDEAYSLTGEGQDYGREAIDTLLKLMEDNRDNLIVVVAGYTDKMTKFLQSNPGLKSRFNKYFYFEDYVPLQLVSIFELFCKNAGFQLSVEAKDKALGIFQVLHDVRDETFGNARLARNVFERSINNQANRIISLPNINEQVLSTIEAIDIPGEVEFHTIDAIK